MGLAVGTDDGRYVGRRVGFQMGLLLVDNRGIREIVGAALVEGEALGRKIGDCVGILLLTIVGKKLGVNFTNGWQVGMR